MTTCSLPHNLSQYLRPFAALALLICPSCTPASHTSLTSLNQGQRIQVTTMPVASPRFQQAKRPRPDSRYRPPKNFAELEAVAGEVARATGRKIRWRLELGENPGPLAKIRGGLDNCTIYLHPVGARTVSPNTWAFIFGHEFAHRVENLGTHAQTNPSNELKADIAGARYAMAAGYRLEAFLGWVLTEPNRTSTSHGSPHQRVKSIAAHFGIPQNVIKAQAQRHSQGRATPRSPKP